MVAYRPHGIHYMFRTISSCCALYFTLMAQEDLTVTEMSRRRSRSRSPRGNEVVWCRVTQEGETIFRTLDVEVASSRSAWFHSRLRCSDKVIDFSVYSSHYCVPESLCDLFFEYLNNKEVPYPFDGRLAGEPEVEDLVAYFGL